MTDVRPEVVDAVASVAAASDPADVIAAAVLLDVAGCTVEERRQGENLAISIMEALSEHRDREQEVFDVLLDGRQFAHPPTWSDLFDGLSDTAINRLGELYPAMPEPVREQFDRRFGKPGL